MSDVIQPAKQTTAQEVSKQEPSNRESLVPGVPADFIIEAIRRIDELLATSEGEGAEARHQGNAR